MIKPHTIYGKKLSLYGKPLKMLPKVSVGTGKPKSVKSGLKFWPQPEEEKDDRLPEPE